MRKKLLVATTAGILCGMVIGYKIGSDSGYNIGIQKNVHQIEAEDKFRELYDAAWLDEKNESNSKFVYAALSLCFGGYDKGGDLIGILDLRNIENISESSPITPDLFKYLGSHTLAPVKVFCTEEAKEKLEGDFELEARVSNYFSSKLEWVIAKKDSDLEKVIKNIVKEKNFASFLSEPSQKYRFSPPEINQISEKDKD